MSRHHQGPSLQPEHSAARGKEALPLPLSITTLSWASRLGDTLMTQRVEASPYLWRSPRHPQANTVLVRNERLKSNDPLKERLESEQ